MPTILRDDSAVHGLALPANTEVVVEFEKAPKRVEVVVTTPGDAPIYWTADGYASEAAIEGVDTRVIPGGVVASDDDRVRAITGDYPYIARIRLISATNAVVSVQRGDGGSY